MEVAGGCSPARLTHVVNAGEGAAQPVFSGVPVVSPCDRSSDTQGTSSVQTFGGQGSTLGVEIASLKIALENAVNTVASLYFKVGGLNMKVNELTS